MRDPRRAVRRFGPYAEVGPEQLRELDRHRRFPRAARQRITRYGNGEVFRRNQLRAKGSVETPAGQRVFRGERRTANQVPQPVAPGVLGNPAPEEGENFAQAVLTINRRSAQFEYLVADALEGSKFKLLGTVIAKPCSGGKPRLHAVGAYHPAVFLVFDDQMIANRIEAIAVESRRVRGRQAFSQLDVEYVETEAAGGEAIVPVLRQAHSVAPKGRRDARAEG